jgi:hypothetical protein
VLPFFFAQKVQKGYEQPVASGKWYKLNINLVFQVVKFLIKAGADIFSRNAAGRTPREEAEATLERVETDELTNTIAFLRDEEARRFEHTTSHYSDVSDGDDDDDEEIDDNEEEKEEPENEDVAKFLGVAKSSPDVQKAFRCLDQPIAIIAAVPKKLVHFCYELKMV